LRVKKIPKRASREGVAKDEIAQITRKKESTMHGKLYEKGGSEPMLKNRAVSMLRGSTATGTGHVQGEGSERGNHGRVP